MIYKYIKRKTIEFIVGTFVLAILFAFMLGPMHLYRTTMQISLGAKTGVLSIEFALLILGCLIGGPLSLNIFDKIVHGYFKYEPSDNWKRQFK